MLFTDVQNIQHCEGDTDFSVLQFSLSTPSLPHIEGWNRSAVVLGDPEDVAVCLVLTVGAVRHVVTDQLGADAGPVTAAEVAGLLHVQVEVEGSVVLPLVSTAAVQKVPGKFPQREVPALVGEGEDPAGVLF